LPAPLLTTTGWLLLASHRPPEAGKQEKNKDRRRKQAVGIVLQRLADRAVEKADQRPQAATAWAPAEQVSIEADRRQSLNQRRRHHYEERNRRAE
jgi:hypothetical protein